jgi:hypothetical protein
METIVNPETGRDNKGRFAKGFVNGAKKRTPRQITQQIRAFAADNKVTEKAVKQLVNIVENKDGKASPSDIIRASDLLLKTFNITVEKDIDKEIAEDTNKTIGEMFADLKGMQNK